MKFLKKLQAQEWEDYKERLRNAPEPYDMSAIIRDIEAKAARRKARNRRPYVKHGSSKNPLYKNWAMLRYRSGKGGTKLCGAWSEDFQVYLKWALLEGGYSRESQCLIRRDGTIEYTPANCYFGTREESIAARIGRLTKRSASGHSGISQVKSTGKWLVQINRTDGIHRLGSFDTLEAAVSAREIWLSGD